MNSLFIWGVQFSGKTVDCGSTVLRPIRSVPTTNILGTSSLGQSATLIRQRCWDRSPGPQPHGYHLPPLNGRVIDKVTTKGASSPTYLYIGVQLSWLERQTVNLDVVGSSPSTPANCGWLPRTCRLIQGTFTARLDAVIEVSRSPQR